MRRGTAWVLSIPIALAGCLAAHALAYRLVAPDAHERAHLLASSGHGYLAHLRVVAAAALALLVVAFVRQAAAAARGLEPEGPSRLVALVPPLAFVGQEHLERSLHDGAFPLDALTQPSFLVGLALQLPFALLALAGARLLSRAAAALGRLLGRRPHRTATAPPRAVAPDQPHTRSVAGARGRGPPAFARP